MQISTQADRSHGTIILQTEEFVKSKLGGDSTGHDWWHVNRVRNVALHIGQLEKADLFIIELAALLHDIADYKFHNGDETIGPKVAKEWLTSLQVSSNIIEHVCDIIETISFKGGTNMNPMKTLEGMIVQDADRLDAIGAVGIARCFAYGGFKGNYIYDPSIEIKKFNTFDEYKKSKGTSINHFYEKLLLLRERMNTLTGRKIAEHRHTLMENYLNEFFSEWNFN